MTTIRLHKGEVLEQVWVDQPQQLLVEQEEGSILRLHMIHFHAGDDNLRVVQLGQHCTTELYGLAMPRGDERVSIHTNVRHEVGGGKSAQLVKFALDDTSRGEFFGELYIAPDAQQTEALQTNRNILLSAGAEMRTRPQLEIYADDVKASHGASTGQLDESSLFYMQQRGISRETGRQLLIAAFLKEVVEKISDENQRNQLLDAIDGIIQ